MGALSSEVAGASGGGTLSRAASGSSAGGGTSGTGPGATGSGGVLVSVGGVSSEDDAASSACAIRKIPGVRNAAGVLSSSGKAGTLSVSAASFSIWLSEFQTRVSPTFVIFPSPLKSSGIKLPQNICAVGSVKRAEISAPIVTLPSEDSGGPWARWGFSQVPRQVAA